MTSSLQVNAVSVTAGGDTPLLEEVSLTVKPGEFVGIVGANGAGKTTLLRAILGLVRPSAGDVNLMGKDAQSLSGRERAAHLAWLPQKGAVWEPLSVLDFVIASRFRFDETRKEALSACRQALAEVDALEFAGRRITSLSGGEAQRVSMAALFAQEATFLLLDEPANHLDPAHQRRAYAYLAEKWRAGHGVICVTHDLNLLGSIASTAETPSIRILGLESGRVSFETTLDSPTLADALSAMYGVSFRTVNVDGERHLVVTGAPS